MIHQKKQKTYKELISNHEKNIEMIDQELVLIKDLKKIISKQKKDPVEIKTYKKVLDRTKILNKRFKQSSNDINQFIEILVSKLHEEIKGI